jgi:hypothetical protein
MGGIPQGAKEGGAVMSVVESKETLTIKTKN